MHTLKSLRKFHNFIFIYLSLIIILTRYRYGVLTYALVGGDSTSFNIDPVTGDVTTAIVFTYAGKRSQSFNVTATDAGGYKAQIPVQVQINRYDSILFYFLA